MTGPQIRAARKARGWTQKQLATQVGVSQAAISQWERGNQTPGPDQLTALRQALQPSDGPATGQLPLAAEAASSYETASPTAAEAPPTRVKKAKKGKKAKKKGKTTSASLGFEAKLWEAADLLRSNMDPAEYKHVVLGLLFLKYISDAFAERQEQLRHAICEDTESDYYIEGEAAQQAELDDVLEDKDEYTSESVFWVPPTARWSHIQAHAKMTQVPLPDGRKGTIGQLVDAAMDAIEAENPSLKHTLPREFAKPGLDQESLGKLIDLVSGIGLGTAEHRAKDTLGRVYEYFLSRFASAEGKGGGEFYTPSSIVRVLVEMLEPYSGRVYDPCCGSGGMFVQSLKFIEQHNGQKDQVSVYGQEYNRTTWRLAKMNLAIRGIEAKLGERHADTFRDDQHPDLRADYILANPPFNISQWHGEQLRDDVRWTYGVPPVGNANYAWVQHMVHHLAPGGFAGFVLANGSMSTMQSGEGDIRQALVEADKVDCIVALPGQLFYSTQIPVCLWFLTDSKTTKAYRDRTGETLFIDARKLGRLETRVHRVLDDADIQRIAGTYHAWRTDGGGYEDEAGFCKSATTEEIGGHGYVLTPGRYVAAEEVEDDGEPFEEKIDRLGLQLASQFSRGAVLQQKIMLMLRQVGLNV